MNDRESDCCANCWAWRRDDTAHPTNLQARGTCRRHAPQSGSYGHSWPRTTADGWCYEHVPAPGGVLNSRPTGLPERLVIRYRNWRGEESVRTVLPVRLYYGSTTWHAGPGWLLDAVDESKGEMRTFDLASVLEWLDPLHGEKADCEEVRP